MAYLRQDRQDAKTAKMMRGNVIAQGLTPSPGTPGEGGGEGDFNLKSQISNFKFHPHPNPLPAYGSTELAEVRERGPNIKNLSPWRSWRLGVLGVLGVLSLTLSLATPTLADKFHFAADAAETGSTLVSPETAYDASRGYGFESPTVFSVKVPEGNHLVTVTFGGDSETDLTVKAEARRLLIEHAKNKAGEVKTVTFVVNTRTPKIESGGAVKLNTREIGSPSWDDKLTLEFLGSAHVRTVSVEPIEVPTVYIAGDSTVTDQAEEPWAAWGQMLPRFFKPTVAVANHAESGRALSSFRGERRLDKILSVIKPGDYLFIQFGHNDQKEKGEGVGAFTTFKKRLEEYVQLARDKKATPVIVTPMYRRRFTDGKLQESLGDFPAAMKQVAEEQKVALIDLHEMSGKFFQSMGDEGSKKAFVHYPANSFPGQTKALKDDTHFNTYGGYELARCVVEAIRTGDLPLAKELSEDVKPFDPAKPDDLAGFNISASAARASKTPEGS